MKTRTNAEIYRSWLSLVRGETATEEFIESLIHLRDERKWTKSEIGTLPSPIRPILQLGSSAFALMKDILVVRGLPPVHVVDPLLPPNYRNAQLLVSEVGGELTLELISRPCPKKTNKPHKRRGGGGRIHNDAAIFVTKKVYPRTASGGLPTLGKRVKR